MTDSTRETFLFEDVCPGCRLQGHTTGVDERGVDVWRCGSGHVWAERAQVFSIAADDENEATRSVLDRFAENVRDIIDVEVRRSDEGAHWIVSARWAQIR